MGGVESYHNAGPFRQRTTVQWTDRDFGVRLVSLADLLRIQRDSVEIQLSTRWTSEEALRRQVATERMMFLCPLYRNGGPVDAPESYKCWIWYFLRSDEHARGLSLLDVRKDIFNGLSEVTESTELKHVISALVAGIAEGSTLQVLP